MPDPATDGTQPAGAPPAPSSPISAGTPPAQDGASGGTTPGTTQAETPPQGTPPAKTLTQDEVNRIVEDRLKRERDATAARLTELEARSAKLQAIEDAGKTETERQAAQAEAARKEADAAKAKYEAELADTKAKQQEAEKRAVNAERAIMVTRLAVELGAIDPSDANILAAASEIDPKAADAEAKIKEVITALQKARPYLFGQVRGRTLEGFNPGTGAGRTESDAAIFARLQRQSGVNVSPIG
jgi:membrane protein involved in colicin uptake